MCRELLLAASDTTTHAIANALYLMLTEPEIRAALDSEFDANVDALVEEALRIFGSVQYQMRFASRDCEIGGQTVQKGDAIILHHAAANRDPRSYPQPGRADLGRPALKKASCVWDRPTCLPRGRSCARRNP